MIAPTSALAQTSRAIPPTTVVINGDHITPDEPTAPKPRPKVSKPKPVAAQATSSVKSAAGALGRNIDNDMGLGTGRIIVDIAARRLYYGISPQTVRVYPVAVGKSGAQWRGSVVVGRKAVAPAWRPTANQRRKKKLPAYVPPGRSNPLGSHAIYLFKGGKDTLLRIHGTNEPSSIGKAVSAGCIRMRNADVADLYGRVSNGAIVTAR